MLGIALLTVLLRLPYLRAPMSPDEGGFLAVGAQWHHGSSLYGSYWVDRPPLLIAIFRLASLTGGLTSLRLIGCLAAAVTVLGVAAAAAQLSGRRTSVWAAALACGLLATPAAGALNVNGELLAAPFVAMGVALVGRAMLAPLPRALTDVVAGMCAAAALLVKQNMFDVGVFAVVLAIACFRWGSLPLTRLLRTAALFAVGALSTALAVLFAALLEGTSPWGVYFAMYPFRLRASILIGQHPLAGRLHNLQGMVVQWGSTGAPVLLVAFVVLVSWRWFVSHDRSSPASVAVVALMGFDVLSVGVGGSYWLHYMVQLLVPLALAAAWLSTSWPRLGRPLVLLVVLLCATTWTHDLSASVPDRGQAVGDAIRGSADPSDGIVSILGDGDVVRTSGLSSPYPYLWSLPARTLDPGLHRLRETLARPSAPGWVVLRASVDPRRFESQGVGRVLRRRYREVGLICDRAVFLRNDLTRRPVPVPGACDRPLVGRTLVGGEGAP